jgi:flavin reductase (DIM6/NTAB) family NADH-FMN oxidoreductase RutF
MSAATLERSASVWARSRSMIGIVRGNEAVLFRCALKRREARGGYVGCVNSVSITPSILYFGTPVVVVSTLNPDGSPNLSVISSAWALGQRVVLGLGVHGRGWQNLERTHECVLNLPSSDLWQAVERLAPTTGCERVPAYKLEMGYRFDAHKFDTGGFTPVSSSLVRPPRVAECALQLEARVLSVHAPSAGEDGWRIVETQIVKVHAHENIVVPDSSRIDPTRWNPLLYVFRHYFGTGAELGRNFRAEA